jgi:broad specificity phosphatase PhoE
MVREKKHWPVLQMDPAMKEFDEAWQKETRETLSELGLRISLFLEFLVGRSETNVVVVTHGVWLEECFRLHCPKVLDNGKRRVYNCDMFVFDCVSQNRKFLRLENPHQI